MYSDELYHHGILGMKWGVRNGPPYPLDAKDHSVREKKAGWRKSLHGNRKKQSGNKGQVSESNSEDSRLKKVLNSRGFKVALGVSIAAVGTYAAYRYGRRYLVGGKKFDRELRKGLKNAISQFDDAADELKDFGYSKKEIAKLRKQTEKTTKEAYYATRENYKNLSKNYNSVSDLPKSAKNYAKDYFTSDSDDAYKILTKGINHGVDEQTLADDLFSGGGRHMNCTFCSAAMAMRMKGYDVTAAETKMGVFTYKNQQWFEQAKFVKPKIDNPRSFYSYLHNLGNGHYGFLNVELESGGKHSVFFTVNNGAVEIIDGQLNKSYGKVITDLEEKLFSGIKMKQCEICDVTNLKPTDKILKALDGVGSKAEKKAAKKAAKTEKRLLNNSDNQAAKARSFMDLMKDDYDAEVKRGLVDSASMSFDDWLKFMGFSN